MKLEDARSILVYGGSFDPPHRAHVELPMLAREKIGADLVAYIPAGRAPHKLDREQTAAEHRLAMLRLALQDTDRAVILMDELDRAASGRPSYTVDTLEALSRRLPAGVSLRLLMGTDQVHIFDQWREHERVAELAPPLVMVRPPETSGALLASLPEEGGRPWRARLIELPRLDISSTDIRRRIAAGQSTEGLLAPAVRGYIDAHGLYG